MNPPTATHNAREIQDMHILLLEGFTIALVATDTRAVRAECSRTVGGDDDGPGDYQHYTAFGDTIRDAIRNLSLDAHQPRWPPT